MISFPYLFLSSIFLQILLLKSYCIANEVMASIWFDLFVLISFCPAFLFLFCKWEYKVYCWILPTHAPFTATGEQSHCCGRRTVLKGQAQSTGVGVTLTTIQNLIFFNFLYLMISLHTQNLLQF